jgi:hypothetical protein
LFRLKAGLRTFRHCIPQLPREQPLHEGGGVERLAGAIRGAPETDITLRVSRLWQFEQTGGSLAPTACSVSVIEPH